MTNVHSPPKVALTEDAIEKTASGLTQKSVKYTKEVCEGGSKAYTMSTFPTSLPWSELLFTKNTFLDVKTVVDNSEEIRLRRRCCSAPPRCNLQEDALYNDLKRIRTACDQRIANSVFLRFHMQKIEKQTLAIVELRMKAERQAAKVAKWRRLTRMPLPASWCDFMDCLERGLGIPAHRLAEEFVYNLTFLSRPNYEGFLYTIGKGLPLNEKYMKKILYLLSDIFDGYLIIRSSAGRRIKLLSRSVKVILTREEARNFNYSKHLGVCGIIKKDHPRSFQLWISRI